MRRRCASVARLGDQPAAAISVDGACLWSARLRAVHGGPAGQASERGLAFVLSAATSAFWGLKKNETHGRSVQVILEHESSPGKWIPVGQAVATVKSGAVRAAVTPDPGAMKGSGR